MQATERDQYPTFDMRLLPKSQMHGWAPYTWLAYFGFFFIDPIVSHAGWKEWIWTAIGTLIFLVLYFAFFWLPDQWQRYDIGALILLGIAYSGRNGGAACFFTFAAAFMPFAFQKEKYAALGLGIFPLIAFTRWYVWNASPWELMYSGILPVVVGGGNIYFAARNRMYEELRVANNEIEHLAKVAERERIARDLHDVLGHTLSVIILKSELAGKLIDRDPARAKAEIGDVERTSREALAEVRTTIRGYRLNSLAAELKQAESTLQLAGVAVKSETSEVPLTAAQESVVALVVREAVTNVVRHAAAKNCSVRLGSTNGTCRLEVQDDGLGAQRAEGNGLRGMRERVEALGGTLRFDSAKGTNLKIEFPLTLPCKHTS
jgi:two-component system, NarL family, sensor histidine kinase DesK